ncbi:cytochrome P450 [Amylocystis lapponica]|nr:cytochrome P450 [Amylocystis lapponica]
MSLPLDLPAYSSSGAIALLAIFCLAFLGWLQGRRGLRLPPGPTALPIIGNLHQLPTEYSHEVFANWASKYGDLIYAKMFRTPLLIINTPEIAYDLLTKRSATYSGRINSTLMNDLVGWDSSLIFMNYGERFKKHRRWMHEAFQTKMSLMDFRPLQRREVDLLVAGLSETPHAFSTHIQRFAAALILEPAYGRTVTSMDDEYVKLVNTVNHTLAMAGNAGITLVDFFPILKYVPGWMPGAMFKRRAAAGKALVRQLLDLPYESVVKNMVRDALSTSGVALPSFVATLIETISGKDGLDETNKEDVKGAASILYGAGAATTNSVLLAFFLMMVLYPEVQAKAQQEISRVVGSERLPEYDDRESLPYLESLLREVYRWCCPVPLGIPHLATADNEYRSYHIAKETVVIANIWSMTRDENVFPEPETFRPERFENMAIYTTELTDPRNLIFGFGRRICPGQQFADANIWLALANILASIDIRRVRGADGNEITPVPMFRINSSLERHVEPFVCEIRGRSGEAKHAVVDFP